MFSPYLSIPGLSDPRTFQLPNPRSPIQTPNTRAQQLQAKLVLRLHIYWYFGIYTGRKKININKRNAAKNEKKKGVSALSLKMKVMRENEFRNTLALAIVVIVDPGNWENMRSEDLKDVGSDGKVHC